MVESATKPPKTKNLFGGSFPLSSAAAWRTIKFRRSRLPLGKPDTIAQILSAAAPI
jgi:hypothetical protein